MIMTDGDYYHFRFWPDDGETFEFRAFGTGGEGVLVNLTNPGPENDYWVRADGRICTRAGQAVMQLDDLAAGPALTDQLTWGSIAPADRA